MNSDSKYRPMGPAEAVTEWRAWLMTITMIALAFEVVSGLVAYLVPFSVFSQYSVLLHTIVGLIWTPLFAWYSWVHWSRRFRGKFNHVQLLGYAGFALIAGCVVTGIVLTFQAAFRTRISYTWDLVHLVTGLGLIFGVVAHIVVVWVRKSNAPEVAIPLQSAKRVFLGRVGVGTAIMLAAHFALASSHREVVVNNEFPADYSWKFGEDRPFAPSLARTVSNRAYDPATLSGSAGCGTSGCHSDILREWEPSAHRYSAADLAFQSVQRIMLDDIGAESTRYCAGCHDPITLLSGNKNVNVEALSSVGADEGSSCVLCHSIVQTDVRGNADYTVAQPVRYVGELKDGALNKWVSDFLIRAYPRHHKETFARPLYKTAEYCAACHKQYIDAEVNQIGWIQLQNQYDNWRKSRWYHEGNPTKTITCRECHMPLSPSTDPAAGDTADYNRTADDGKHRSHRFLAANQVMPLLMDLPGAKEHVALTEAWLRGEIEIPEIADKWTTGPVIRLELTGPESVKPGEPVNVQVILTNSKTGHGFPTGPLDIIRSWVELTVRDETGAVVYQIGQPDEQGRMAEDTIVFKVDGIDRYGNDIDRHNLWEMVGARFKRTMFPGTSDTETYTFACPGFVGPSTQQVDADKRAMVFLAPEGAGQLTVEAVLNYQKADAIFLDKVFGVEAGIRTPITAISRDVLKIRVDR